MHLACMSLALTVPSSSKGQHAEARPRYLPGSVPTNWKGGCLKRKGFYKARTDSPGSHKGFESVR